jgi:hypothetical protein
MGTWQVVVESFPKDHLRDLYRIWRKHDHDPRDEEILRKVAAFGGGGDGLAIACYEHEEAAQRVVAEVENLDGKARLEALESQ